VVAVPGSKSQTLRALAIAALSEGTSTTRGALRAEDSLHLARALCSFGAVDIVDSDQEFEVHRAPAGRTAPTGWIDIGAGAAPARFLIAFAACATGTTRITGTPRLCERPMATLIESLAAAGIACDSIGTQGCLPVAVHGRPLATRCLNVSADGSSQFASALLLALSEHDEPAELIIEGDAVSRPYLEMTCHMLAESGVHWTEIEKGRWQRQPGRLRARAFFIEPDASSAGYFFALAAATGSTAALDGIPANSRQADLALLDALASMGCRVRRDGDRIEVTGAPLRGVDMDLRDAPDAAPTLAALATLATGATTIRGVAHLRAKESDRIAATCAEAERLGARTTSGDDWMRIEPAAHRTRTVVQTHDDHRLAMAFSVVGAAREGVWIADPLCVAKSFPGYWAEFDRFLAHHRGRDGATRGRDA
jgi:3-phosphoshikimate 1-carboxyvinyltransferase